MSHVEQSQYHSSILTEAESEVKKSFDVPLCSGKIIFLHPVCLAVWLCWLCLCYY